MRRPALFPVLTGEARFDPGWLEMEPDAAEALLVAGQSPLPLLARHSRGDWGELSGPERETAEAALAAGGEVSSRFLHRGDMGAAGDDEHVDEQRDGHQAEGEVPAPRGNIHGNNLPVTETVAGGLSRPMADRRPGSGGDPWSAP